MKRKQGRGHYCYLCGRHRPNEAFGGKGHARHLCRECARRPREERERIEVAEELWGYWFQSRISPKNLLRLETLESHTDPELRATAALVRAAGLAHPGRRGRLRHLRREHPELLERLVTQGLVEDWGPYAGPGEQFLEEGEPWGEPWGLSHFNPAETMTARKTLNESSAPLYQLKVALKGVKPPVWRRILVPGESTFARLHTILQAAMGWGDCHLHEFRFGREFRIGTPDPEWDAPGAVRDERRVTLSSLAPDAKDKFTYVYDFGDDWEHTVLVEKVLPADPAAIVPACLAGKGACPPEDSGGVGGYFDMQSTLADPEDPEHEERLEWLGGEWDAAAFDLEETNRRQAPLRKR